LEYELPTVEIVCLANSRKAGGRCIAGVRTDTGAWVRPVSSGREGTLRPALLDTIICEF
jgi:hypothetical protein